jgi:hypothetical protein
VVKDFHKPEVYDYEIGIAAKELDRIVEDRLVQMLEVHKWTTANRKHQVPVQYTSMLDVFEKPEQAIPSTLLQDTIDGARIELARVSRRIDVAQDLMTNTELREAYASKARLTKRITDLESRQAHEGALQDEREQAKGDLEDACDKWHDWDIERQRRFIRLVTQEITIEKLGEGWIRLVVTWCPYLDMDISMVQSALIWKQAGSEWSEQDIDTLRTHYSTATRGQLLHLFPMRTWQGIKSKGKEKGLRRPTMATDTDLPENMSLLDRDIIERYELPTKDLWGKSLLDSRVWWVLGGTVNSEYQT